MDSYREHVYHLVLRDGAGYLSALAAVSVVSGIIGMVESVSHVANISMLYLIAVLVTATAYGSGPAVLASIAAFLTFDWFFVLPLHAFTIADPGEWIALLLFLLTAITTGQLAAGQRRRAQEARHREREAVVLFDVVQAMARYDPERALQAAAEVLREELSLAAVVVELNGDDDRVTQFAAAGDDDTLALLQASGRPVQPRPGMEYPSAMTEARKPGRWVRIIPPRVPSRLPHPLGDRLFAVPVNLQDRRRGTLFLVRKRGSPRFTVADDRLLFAAAAQIGLSHEREQLRREATEAEILRRTDDLKTALLNAVSHDLRTPLASIVTSAGTLRQSDVAWTEGEKQEFLQVIEEEAQRLSRIVGNLLDLSRMEAGTLRVEKMPYDLETLVADVLGRLHLTVAQHRLLVDIPRNLPPVPLDYVQIDQVLSNLIENAAKYAPRATEISVSVRRSDGEIEVAVADRGPGIEPTALSHLFRPFYRAEGRHPTVKGLGLGLSVAKGLVEAHGGSIRAENRPDGGAQFTFTLPLNHPSSL